MKIKSHLYAKIPKRDCDIYIEEDGDFILIWNLTNVKELENMKEIKRDERHERV